jgi:hypothetical protein
LLRKASFSPICRPKSFFNNGGRSRPLIGQSPAI